MKTKNHNTKYNSEDTLMSMLFKYNEDNFLTKLKEGQFKILFDKGSLEEKSD